VVFKQANSMKTSYSDKYGQIHEARKICWRSKY